MAKINDAIDALPTHDECVEKRINHAYTNEYGTIVLNIYIFDKKEVYTRLASGASLKSEDNSTGKDSLTENTIITEDDFYIAYEKCKYHFTRLCDGYECTQLIPAIYNPACPYCGQSAMCDHTFISQDEANKWATMRCTCKDGAPFRAEQKLKADREENISKIKENIENYSAYCESKHTPLTDDIKDMLLTCAVMAVDHIIDGAAVNFGRIKTKVSINAKGAVALTFAYSDSLKTEV